MNSPSLSQRFVEWLNQNCDVAFRADQSVCLGIERSRAGGAAGLSVGKQNQAVGFDAGRSTDKCDVRLAGFDRLSSQQQRDERRRTRRIDRAVRSVELQGSRDKARDHVGFNVGFAVRPAL